MKNGLVMVILIFAFSIVELESTEDDTPNCDDPDPPCQQSQTKQINGKYVWCQIRKHFCQIHFFQISCHSWLQHHLHW